MKISDVHIHAENTTANPKHLVEKMKEAGVDYACVFSNCPPEADSHIGTTFDERLGEILSWTKGYEDILFPVLWIHPYEENIFEKIQIAVDRGICAFKIICNNFYVYEEKSIEVLKKIAKLNKPVFFHSGILWDGMVSSKYNRPLNWEALLEIDGLRFSMGHCSWPWIDECVAMYGKFMNSLGVRENSAEMFFDTTPGTPKIYRRDLLEKLFKAGYDVEHNVMFGCDCYAHNYNSKWVSEWLETDRKIMDDLGVSKRIRENMYYNNLMRFLGKTETKVEHAIPSYDNADTWNCYNAETETVIRKWYNELHIPAEFDFEFEKALSEIKISDAISIEHYDIYSKDGRRNLLSYLFMCQALSEKYERMGIPNEVLMDTLSDMPVWLCTWSDIKGELYLGETHWLAKHLSMKLFKLGRLQFYMGKAKHAIPSKNILKNDDVIEIHIPEGSPLDVDECKKSVEMAKEFFAKYFPDYKYKGFTCHAWLLDRNLDKYLKTESNILKFQNMFTIVREEESDTILKRLFGVTVNRRNIINFPARSGFAAKIKDAVLSGEVFYEGYGVID